MIKYVFQFKIKSITKDYTLTNKNSLHYATKLFILGKRGELVH